MKNKKTESPLTPKGGISICSPFGFFLGGWIMWGFLLACPAWAQTLVVKGDSLTYDIGKYVQTLYDTEGTLDIKEILLPTQQARFRKENNLKKGIKQHWYKLEIDNQTGKAFFYLDIYNSLHSELYIVQNEHITRLANGIKTPTKERAYLGSLSKYPLMLGTGKTTLYLAYRYLNDCKECLGKKYFWLHDAQTVFKDNFNFNLMNFVILSILVALFVYNLFIYWLVKDLSYLYYVASLGCMVMYLFLGYVLPNSWFRPDGVYFVEIFAATSNLFSVGGLIFFIRFSQTYLNTYLAYPAWHKWLNRCMLLVGILEIPAFFAVLFMQSHVFFIEICLLIVNSIIGISTLFLAFISWVVWKNKTPTGKYYAYSNVVLFISVIVYLGGLNDIRLYNHTFWTFHSLKIGLAVQMLLFSVALAGRINLLKQEIADKKLENERLEKEQAIEIQILTAKKNLELEQKVKERTADLEKSNEEIRTQSEQIELQARLLDDQKNRQLMEKTLQITQKNDLLPEVSKFLENITSQLTGDMKQESKSLQKKMTQNLSSDTHWDNLKTHFEEVHPTLFAKLYELCPDFTTTDLRYCAYQKMGLNKKEIAILLNLDPESVRKHQYRIKKKLNLAEEVSFADFIMSIH